MRYSDIPTRRQRAHYLLLYPFKMRRRIYRMELLLNAVIKSDAPTTPAEHEYWSNRAAELTASIGREHSAYQRGLLTQYEYRIAQLDLALAIELAGKPVYPITGDNRLDDAIGFYDMVI